MKLLELCAGESFPNKSEESALPPCDGGMYALMRRSDVVSFLLTLGR
jgi:hypothetical protein